MTAARKPGEREENETEKGLRVQDKGFLNTAVIRSEITYIDGDAGGMYALRRSRGVNTTYTRAQFSDTGADDVYVALSERLNAKQRIPH